MHPIENNTCYNRHMTRFFSTTIKTRPTWGRASVWGMGRNQIEILPQGPICFYRGPVSMELNEHWQHPIKLQLHMFLLKAVKNYKLKKKSYILSSYTTGRHWCQLLWDLLTQGSAKQRDLWFHGTINLLDRGSD